MHLCTASSIYEKFRKKGTEGLVWTFSYNKEYYRSRCFHKLWYLPIPKAVRMIISAKSSVS